jgi:protein-L-isoaspartate(D-aspartate) O-methyltransferase
MTDYAVLRQRMVDNQLRPNDVTKHAVLRAFLNVPRELFAAPADAPFAYADRELAMADAAPMRRMMDPVPLARLINALPLSADAKVMVVGCGTGYSATILARLAGEVVAVEEDATLAALARDRLAALGAANVEVVEAKLTDGCPGKGPYDAILVDGAIERMPEALVGQLKPGGILATIERDERVSRAVLFEQVGREATKLPRFDAWATLLPGFARRREFVF